MYIVLFVIIFPLGIKSVKMFAAPEVVDRGFAESVLNHLTLLKGLAQAKIIKKSVILFRVLNMTIWCKHVHRLELQIFIISVLRVHQLG